MVISNGLWPAPYTWTSQAVLAVKNLSANAGDLRDTGSIARLGRSPGGGYGNPLQYSCLENPMNRGSGQAIIHRVIKRKSWSRLKSLNMSLQCYGEKNAWRKGFWIGEEKRTIVKASTLATSCEELTHWKDSDAGRDWGQEEKGMTEDEMAVWHHGLDGRWVWVNSRSWWWTGRPGVLRFMGSQRVRHDWATELNWTESK